MSNGPLRLTNSTVNKNATGGNGGGINSEAGLVKTGVALTRLAAT
jgi:hypothetical protein